MLPLQGGVTFTLCLLYQQLKHTRLSDYPIMLELTINALWFRGLHRHRGIFARLQTINKSRSALGTYKQPIQSH